ncbi:MAG: hypothetical protein CBB68_00750 [Rhodospirillaceae bacterium TMED8]|nr:hypothetical protein [Magnetovibrio sp.]OUT53215.1 MAG: hypothetical protein CBB68_00750 [Rhodospirillaceae bacterium TMED8]|tara:strand:+ start:880 stop:1143 length:264 start_codon:yes stop_codon:yes gene_type:complete
MTDSVKIVSPCIGVCELDEAQNFCLGCFRSAKEIGAWRYADDIGKIKILRDSFERWQAAPKPSTGDNLGMINYADMAERFTLMGLLK